MANTSRQIDEAASALAAMTGGVQQDALQSQWARLWLAGVDGMMSPMLNEPLKPYEQSLWVYRCISEIQKTAKGIPVCAGRIDGMEYQQKSVRKAMRATAKRTLKAMGGTKRICQGRAKDGELLETGDAVGFITRPNGYQDWPAFFNATIGFLLLRGKVAWVMSDMTGNRPGETHVIDGRYIKPVMNQDANGMPVLLGYEYTAPKTNRKIAFSPDEVKFFGLWTDSSNPFDSMSPNMPGRLAIATEYNASLYNASALQNNGEPGLVVTAPAALTPEQRNEFRLSLEQRHSGPQSAKRVMLLEGASKAESFASTFADLQFDQGKRTTRLEICCLYGVPPVVAGWVDAAGDSSAYTANALEQFYQQTLFPLLDGFVPAIEEIIQRFDASACVWFDVEDQPVVQRMRMGRLDSATKLFAMGYPVNAINEKLDLGMPAVPWGDMGMLPAGLLPAGDVASGQIVPVSEPAPTEPPADDLGQEGAGSPISRRRPVVDQAGVDRLWRAWMNSWSPLARSMEQLLRTRYMVQQRRVLESLKKNLLTKSSAVANEDGTVAQILLSLNVDQDAFRARVRAISGQSAELGIRQALHEAGITGDELEASVKRMMADPSIIEQLKGQAVKIAMKIDARTRDLVKGQLETGLGEGEDLRKLADRVQGVMQNRRAAAISVARNAVGQTLSMTRHAASGQAGMTHKIWLHSRGPGVRRPSHVAAERQYASNPIPIEDPFIIDGVALMYPRDFACGHPEETMNCQCIVIYKRLASADEPFADFPESFYTYSQMMAAGQGANA